ncbi:MAG: TetR/AcrR family transcriptional regulator [Vallitalea sp.]|jgi:AcrR family transcriptional regulator|nr:TetR/AcrR family transcriptional regulator [Vallitalea sp.]
MNKRILIFEAATKIMTIEGVNGITISKVANEAGIGKSTVYEYFTSKNELIYKTISFAGENYLEEIKQRLLSSNRGFEETLKMLIRIAIETMRKGNSNIVFIMGDCDKTFKSKDDVHKQIKEVMLNLRMKTFHILEEIIELGVKEGKIKNPKDKVEIIIWQNLLMMLSYEFSGLDEFIERHNVDISNDNKNIDIIYEYLLKIL